MLTEDKKKFWSNEDLRSFPLPSDRIAEDQIVARLTHLNVGITASNQQQVVGELMWPNEDTKTRLKSHLTILYPYE
ncbi:uncharacterized protein LOC143146616 isoform X2 [Ptiloglossa arizonensis]|uniref:uncharacterized protein LOC143146616 isoform X2 n=1 Tax=Ptiloglossa arizonensis TaxID=3350558 RepID=UPI003F9F68BA